MTGSANRLDVHHHLIPPAFTKVMARHGLTEVASTPLPKWTPEQSIDVMDNNGIQTAITSLSAPGVFFGDLAEAKSLARDCNEFAVTMAGNYPGRFGSFAVLPMPFTEQACAEAIYALDVLKADGIVLLGSTQGKFLGDPSFDELMAELDRRQTIVFVHPNIHETSNSIPLKIPHFMIEFLCDTTRAAANLIFSGTMEKYPNIRWILSHAGGFLPFIAWRLSLGNNLPHLAEKAPEGVLHYIRRFYYDTALSPSPFAMAALRELVDPSHILFGSDFPFAPAIITAIEVQNLGDLRIFDPSVMHGIDRGHALNLFPKFKTASDEIPFDSTRMQSGSGFKSAIALRAVRAIDWLRNR